MSSESLAPPPAAATSPPDDEPVTDVVAVEPQPRYYWLVHWITSKHLRWLLLVCLYVIVQPPETGLGIDLCSLHRYTKAPCPGCGMTRSGANLVRGDVVRSIQFHPFGIIFIPVLFGLAGLSLTPMAWREVVARGIARRERFWRITNLVFLWCFLVFGLIRWVAVMAGWLAFPMEWPA
jgi:hypothetical protein